MMVNKIIQDQINRAFKSIPDLKDKFINDLSKLMDIDQDQEVITGVGNVSNLDFDMLDDLNSRTIMDEIEEEHKETCKDCTDDFDCFGLTDGELPEHYWIGEYTDGDIMNDEIVGDYTTHIIVGETYYQVIKSPYVVLRGLCSPCFPGQADLDSKGDYPCYGLQGDPITI
jgi:hypothetical protein